MMDIARVWADRLAVDAENAMFGEYLKWLDGDDDAEEDATEADTEDTETVEETK